MNYEEIVIKEVLKWQKDMLRSPRVSSVFAKGVQDKINSIIPDKAHTILTETIKNMTKAVLKGLEFTNVNIYTSLSLREREYLIEEKFESYRKTGALTGAGIGAGGIVMGFADFPVLITIKMKFLFDMAGIYGYDVKNFKERLFILYIFKLAFSSDKKRRDVYYDILNWDEFQKSLPDNYNEFNWREFQQEYRDYMDISKMLQFIPIVGAGFGAVANYKLLTRLSYIAKNSYRLRLFKQNGMM